MYHERIPLLWNNSDHRLSLGRTGEGGWPPPKFLLIFLTNDKTSEHLTHGMIPRAHFETSLVMVSYYGYDIRHKHQVVKSFSFEWKGMFFQLFSVMKVNFVDKMTQNNYLCVIKHATCKTLLILAVFIWFLILDKIQDGDHVWWRQKPPAVLLHTQYYFTHRNVNFQIKNNFCEKAKADTQTPNSRPGHDIHYNRNGRFHTRDRLFVWDGLSVWWFASDR